jgi:hypothetical protein
MRVSELTELSLLIVGRLGEPAKGSPTGLNQTLASGMPVLVFE